MAHKKLLEALDRSLQDLRGNSKPFGSTLLLFVRDFRQTLPVIPRSTPADEMNACLKNSNLWVHVKTLKLTINIHVQLQNGHSAEIFSDQLLAIGNRIELFLFSFFFILGYKLNGKLQFIITIN